MGSDLYSITLAAGSGNRMPGDMPPKPCCRIGPVSVVVNALATYEHAGIHSHVVVVGCHAAEVMDEVRKRRADVLFAYQRRPRGTGDAVKCALELVASLGSPEHVLICAGDKVVAPRVVRGLLETYNGAGYDLCLAAGQSEHHPWAGRLVARNGLVEGVLEVADIRVRQLAACLRSLAPAQRPATVTELSKIVVRYLPNIAKLAVCFPALYEILCGDAEGGELWRNVYAAAAGIPEEFELRGGPVMPDEAAAAELCNLSIYLGRFGPLADAVMKLGSQNVQGECYFTDVVGMLASRSCKVGLFRVPNPEDVMDFNTLEELETVRRVHARDALKQRRYPKLGTWLNYFADRKDGALADGAVRNLARRIGRDRTAVVVRSPGRINLMGRHIDHQGGMCNLMAIDRELVVAASPRRDDAINIWHSEAEKYPHRSFSFRELTADLVEADWARVLDSQFVRRMVSRNAGDWSNYVKGAALRLKHRFSERKLAGMDVFVCGNIPVAAGLSSSSALVVAVAEALAELNALNIRPREFVDLCGEGEWFAGGPGHSADHAAIKLGREGEVVTFSFFPFQVRARHRFPEDHALMVCHSGHPTDNGPKARQRSAARVACFHMAREIIKREFPRFASRIKHLRDINVSNLDISLPALYRVLKCLPLRLEAREVESLAEQHPAVMGCVSGLDLEEHEFPVRDVAIYGLAECERASRTPLLLAKGDVRGLGQAMNISHDGERVARWRPDRAPFDASASDELLDSLIRRSSSCVEPLGECGAALWQQPGAYSYSTPQIDLLVDRLLACPGVMGAQLAGAGLGGCVMALVQRECTEQVAELLQLGYYLPHGIEAQIFTCRPSRGTQLLTTVEAEEDLSVSTDPLVYEEAVQEA